MSSRPAPGPVPGDVERGCPNCQTLEVCSAVRWQSLDDPSHEESVYRDSFERLDETRFGSIWRSVCCGSRWYLHDGDGLYLLNPARAERLEDWLKRSLKPDGEQLDVLNDIGSPRPHPHHGLRYPAYPCTCVTVGGTVDPWCLIRPVRLPPDFVDLIRGPQARRYLWLDEVEQIQPSRCALPLEIRELTADPEEVGMGALRAVPVEHSALGTFSLEPLSHFVDFELDDGASLVARESVDGKRGRGRTRREPPVTLIVCDPWEETGSGEPT